MVKITSPDIQAFEIEHLDKLRALAPECMVLLKKNGDFPLSSPGKIALYGSGARETIKGGQGSGDVNVRHYVTVEEGLENAGFTVTTKAWMDSYKAAKEESAKRFLDEVLAQAKAAGKPALLFAMGKLPPEPRYEFPISGEGENCVYVLSRNSGEGSDRTNSEGDLRLTSDETRDILACAKKYKRFMLVLNVGGPVDVSPVLDEVENILALSQLGSVTGDAFADVLLGKAYPSGKLTTTWAKADDYEVAVRDFAQRDDTRYREGVFVGYRYYDAAGIHPVFPFGYGLGYADFNTTVTSFSLKDNAVAVTVEVKNVGGFAGKETVQLYYSAPNGRLAKPLRELGCYAKTQELKPGESERLTMMLPIENMASWDEAQDAWLLEKGVYYFFIGQTPAGAISLDDDSVTAQLHSVGGSPDFVDWTPAQQRTAPQQLPILSVKAAELNGLGHYDREKVNGETLTEPDMRDFTDEELAEVCVGKYNKGQESVSFIGSEAACLAGGAGETSGVVSEKGYGSIVMADGPAGLRITTRYIETADGQEGLDHGSFDAYMPLLPENYQKVIQARKAEGEKKEKVSTVLYHYAAAIPIGTALAQSWNPDVAEKCGDVVGEEMEMFGANVWLAPALNIHRSPLCGRNFEYYSEDPVISGKTAAAITRGVQRHEKCAVTIKHFACNNQETNRFGSNSIVSQRAMREIYLKGFEICVKESAPKSLMTSYNLLNGIHTANRGDLLNELLRKEWGFVGFVMTDWGTTSSKFNLGVHGASSPALCIKAGNDMIMPGSKDDVDEILKGLDTGEISRDDLEKSAGRILAMAKRLS